jgi:hypothetical protein
MHRVVDPKSILKGGGLLFCKAAAGPVHLARQSAIADRICSWPWSGAVEVTVVCHPLSRRRNFPRPVKVIELSLNSKGIHHMHSHIREGFIIAAAASLMSSAALAQTVQPRADSAATTVSSTTTAVTATKWMTQEAAGQWRASKLDFGQFWQRAGERSLQGKQIRL